MKPSLSLQVKVRSVYATKHPGHFRRIEAVSKVGEKLRVLDLMDGKVRDAISKAVSAQALYESDTATDYRIE